MWRGDGVGMPGMLGVPGMAVAGVGSPGMSGALGVRSAPSVGLGGVPGGVAGGGAGPGASRGGVSAGDVPSEAAVHRCVGSHLTYDDTKARAMYGEPPSDNTFYVERRAEEVCEFRELSRFPEQATAAYRAGGARIALLGLFPEVSHAWATADGRLCLWNYWRSGGEPVEWAVPDSRQVLVAVGMCRPRSGVLSEAVAQVLVLATPTEVCLVGVCVRGEGEAAALELVDLPTYRILSDNVSMDVIAGGPDGRIWMGGRDGYLHELVYWGGGCRKVCHCGSFARLLPPLAQGWLGTVDPIVQVACSKDGTAVFTLSKAAAIRCFDVSGGPGKAALVNVLSLKQLKSSFSGYARFDGPVVTIAAAHQASSAAGSGSAAAAAGLYDLVAVAQDGFRIYLRCKPRGASPGPGPLVVVKFQTINPYIPEAGSAATGYRATSSGSRWPPEISRAPARPGDPESASGAPTGGREAPLQKFRVSTAFFRANVLCMADTKGDRLIVSAPWTKPSTTEKGACRTAEVCASVAAGDGQVYYIGEMPSALSDGDTFGDEELLANAGVSAPRHLLVMLGTRVYMLSLLRQVDVLERLLVQRFNTLRSPTPGVRVSPGVGMLSPGMGVPAALAPQSPAEVGRQDALAALWEALTDDEGCAMCIDIALHKGHGVSGEGALHLFREKRGHATFETAKKADDGFIGSVHMMGNAKFSPGHNGICRCLARILRPVWKERAFAFSRSGSPRVNFSDALLHRVDASLRRFCDLLRAETPLMEDSALLRHSQMQQAQLQQAQNAQHQPMHTPGVGFFPASDGSARKRTRTGLFDRDDSEASQEEMASLWHARAIAERASEGIKLLRTFSSHNLNLVFSTAERNLRGTSSKVDTLRELRFSQLVATAGGQVAAHLLIEALIDTVKFSSGGAVDGIMKQVLESFPIFFTKQEGTEKGAYELISKGSDADVAQALSSLCEVARSKAIGGVGDLTQVLDFLDRALAKLPPLHPGVVDICCAAADALDPHNEAAYSTDEGGIVWRAARRDVYAGVAKTLRECMERARDRSTDAHVLAMQNRLLQRCMLRRDDPVLHHAVAEVLADPRYVGTSAQQILIELPSDHVEGFLMEDPTRAHILWRHLAFHNRFREAAYVIEEFLVDAKNATPIGDRFGLICTAVTFAKSAIDSSRLPAAASAGVDQFGMPLAGALHDPDHVQLLEGRKAVIDLQQRLYDVLKRGPGSVAGDDYELERLATVPVSMNDLYEVASHYAMWAMCLEIVKESSDPDPELVLTLWKRIVNQAKKETPELASACAVVAEIGSRLYRDRAAFPLPYILELLEVEALRRGDPTDLGTVPRGLLVAVPTARDLLQAYGDVLSGHDTFFGGLRGFRRDRQAIPGGPLRERLQYGALLSAVEWAEECLGAGAGGAGDRMHASGDALDPTDRALADALDAVDRALAEFGGADRVPDPDLGARAFWMQSLRIPHQPPHERFVGGRREFSGDRREGQLRDVSEVALALDALEARIQASTTTPGAWDVDRDLRTFEELLTRQLTALDSIGSLSAGSALGMDPNARAQRKQQIARVERLSRQVQDHHARAVRNLIS